MAIKLNHVIVWSKDQKEGAKFLADMFDLPVDRYSHFDVVTIDGISFDYANSRSPQIQRQHIAFLVSDEEFDQIFARLEARKIPYWADPKREKPNEICPDDEGRGIYFPDPSDHNFEIITRPYGREAGHRNPEASAERDAMDA